MSIVSRPKFVFVAVLVATSCSRRAADEQVHSAASRAKAVDASLFLAEGLASPVQEVPCTLQSGEATTCRGHTDAVRGYHYHVAGPGENQTLGCLAGEIVEGAARRPPGPPPGE